MEDVVEVDNPWEVSNLECFLFYCCPECEYRCQDIHVFESHAGDEHPHAKKSIGRMKVVLGLVQGEKGHHFCKLCGKYFTSSQRWSSHMKGVHGDPRPYKCDQCNAGFTQLADVQRHSDRVHKNDRPHRCEHCSEGQFSRKYELTQHIKNVHPEHYNMKEVSSTAVTSAEKCSGESNCL